jgi:hypothetical protein
MTNFPRLEVGRTVVEKRAKRSGLRHLNYARLAFHRTLAVTASHKILGSLGFSLAIASRRFSRLCGVRIAPCCQLKSHADWIVSLLWL